MDTHTWRRRGFVVLVGTLAIGGASAIPAPSQQSQQPSPERRDGTPEAAQQRRSQQIERSGRAMQEGDRALEDRVLARIAERTGVGPDMQVRADRGTVTLSGTVSSEAAERRALRAARRTPGVTNVRDELQIARPRIDVPQVGDAELNRRVAQQIARAIPGAKAGEDWWFSGWRVEGLGNDWNFVVESTDGEVVLEGEVPRHSIIRDALDAARQVAGVRRVESQLEVEPVRGIYDYGPYGWYGSADPYAYGPYAFHPGVAGPGPGPFEGRHVVTGTVRRIDRQAGRLTLDTREAGTVTLPFSPGSLAEVREGEQLSVHLGFADVPPAASPGGPGGTTDAPSGR